MPAPAETVVRPQNSTIDVSIEPVHNVLHSMILISKAAYLSGLGEWVLNTREALTAAELNNHRLIVEGLHYALLPQRRLPSFPAYLDYLEEMDPVALRDQLLDSYFDLTCMRDEPGPYTTYEEVLRSPESYVDFLIGRFGAEIVDPELERQAYTYAVNPAAMQILIVSHLRMMWDRFLAAEWDAVAPMLADSAAAFNDANLKGKSFQETAEFVTGQSLDNMDWPFIENEYRRLVLIPSAHIGPYLGRYYEGDSFLILFGARLPEGATGYAPDLSRNEIVVRLNAMADDTRLRILRYISDNGEQRSQDIMYDLNLSQSAASRHLKQLSATGYLVERRCEGAKCYSLGEERLRDTFQAVLAFLAVTP